MLDRINFQDVQKQVDGDGSTLLVHSMWDTIQGEGPFAGVPATFIRLGGCNLQCPLCDTEYTRGTKEMSVREIVDFVTDAPRSNKTLVVITGGEPFRQPLEQLVKTLTLVRLVQIETNGTFAPRMESKSSRLTVVCSPKTPSVCPEMRDWADAWKYVVRAGSVDQFDGLPTSVLGMSCSPSRPTNSAPVYVQPCDDQNELKNRLNTDVAVDACVQYNYRLCLQIQKIIRMP